MTTKSESPSLTIASLPPLGGELDGGIFAGITTKKEGTHHAVVLLPGHRNDVNWSLATEWAQNQGGELPSRPVASLLFANVKASLMDDVWHWTSEEYSASYAWVCYFGGGHITSSRKSYEGSVVAVRLIPVNA